MLLEVRCLTPFKLGNLRVYPVYPTYYMYLFTSWSILFSWKFWLGTIFIYFAHLRLAAFAAESLLILKPLQALSLFSHYLTAPKLHFSVKKKGNLGGGRPPDPPPNSAKHRLIVQDDPVRTHDAIVSCGPGACGRHVKGAWDSYLIG